MTSGHRNLNLMIFQKYDHLYKTKGVVNNYAYTGLDDVIYKW